MNFSSFNAFATLDPLSPKSEAAKRAKNKAKKERRKHREQQQLPQLGIDIETAQTQQQLNDTAPATTLNETLTEDEAFAHWLQQSESLSPHEVEAEMIEVQRKNRKKKRSSNQLQNGDLNGKITTTVTAASTIVSTVVENCCVNNFNDDSPRANNKPAHPEKLVAAASPEHSPRPSHSRQHSDLQQQQHSFNTQAATMTTTAQMTRKSISRKSVDFANGPDEIIPPNILEWAKQTSNKQQSQQQQQRSPYTASNSSKESLQKWKRVQQTANELQKHATQRSSVKKEEEIYNDANDAFNSSATDLTTEVLNQQLSQVLKELQGGNSNSNSISTTATSEREIEDLAAQWNPSDEPQRLMIERWTNRLEAATSNNNASQPNDEFVVNFNKSAAVEQLLCRCLDLFTRADNAPFQLIESCVSPLFSVVFRSVRLDVRWLLSQLKGLGSQMSGWQADGDKTAVIETVRKLIAEQVKVARINAEMQQFTALNKRSVNIEAPLNAAQTHSISLQHIKSNATLSQLFKQLQIQQHQLQHHQQQVMKSAQFTQQPFQDNFHLALHLMEKDLQQQISNNHVELQQLISQQNNAANIRTAIEDKKKKAVKMIMESERNIDLQLQQLNDRKQQLLIELNGVEAQINRLTTQVKDKNTQQLQDINLQYKQQIQQFDSQMKKQQHELEQRRSASSVNMALHQLMVQLFQRTSAVNNDHINTMKQSHTQAIQQFFDSLCLFLIANESMADFCLNRLSFCRNKLQTLQSEQAEMNRLGIQLNVESQKMEEQLKHMKVEDEKVMNMCRSSVKHMLNPIAKLCLSNLQLSHNPATTAASPNQFNTAIQTFNQIEQLISKLEGRLVHTDLTELKHLQSKLQNQIQQNQQQSGFQPQSESQLQSPPLAHQVAHDLPLEASNHSPSQLSTCQPQSPHLTELLAADSATVAASAQHRPKRGPMKRATLSQHQQNATLSTIQPTQINPANNSAATIQEQLNQTTTPSAVNLPCITEQQHSNCEINAISTSAAPLQSSSTNHSPATASASASAASTASAPAAPKSWSALLKAKPKSTAIHNHTIKQ